MAEEKETVLIWYKSKQMWIPKERIIEKLNKENAKKYEDTWDKANQRYNKELLGVCDKILENIDNIGTLQIYEDNIIRLHLKHGHYDKPKIIIFSATEDEVERLKQILKIAI